MKPKIVKICKYKYIKLDITDMEPAEPKELKELECKDTDFTTEDIITENKKIIKIYRCEIECIMRSLEPEKMGVSSYWYRRVYACDSQNRWYGVKKIGFLIFNNHKYPSHDFTPKLAKNWLKYLGLEKNGQDKTAPKKGWKKEDMSGWMKEK